MKSSRHHIHQLDGGHGFDAGAAAAMALYQSLVKAYDAEIAAEGACSIETAGGQSIRCVAQLADGFFACEVLDLDASDAWEAFVLRLPGGESRTGWRRRGHASDEPPDSWLDAIVDHQLGPELTPAVEPTFLALATAFCAGGAPSVSSADAQVRSSLEHELDHWRSVSSSQAASIRSLRLALESVPTLMRPAELAPEPAALTLPDLGTWAAEHVDRIVVLPRAVAGAKKSPFADARLLYASLELLADTYRLVKQSRLPRERLREHADELGLFIGGSVDAGRAGMFGDEYFVSYGGRRRFLDQHIGSGTSRDPRRSLRIYFTWCDETQRVVVGSLPAHLTNSKT